MNQINIEALVGKIPLGEEMMRGCWCHRSPSIAPLFRHNYSLQLGVLLSLVLLLKPAHFTGILIINSAVD